MPLLSVIVPVYNEAGTIKQVLEKISAVNIDKEIIVVDDSSTDGSDKVLSGIKLANLKVIHHSSKRGKGAAFLTGLANAIGEFIIEQDVDLEYDPNDYLKLMEVMSKGTADVILGSRFAMRYPGTEIPKAGNRFLTVLLNMLFGVNINDSFTCYKLMRRDDLLSLKLSSSNFDIEIEILAKAIKKKLRLIEVPVCYKPQGSSGAKKVKIKNGIWAMARIIRFRFN